jgi:hypothetical protein
MFSENISLMTPIDPLKSLEHKLAAVCVQEKGRSSSCPVPGGSDGINPSASRVVTRREIPGNFPLNEGPGLKRIAPYQLTRAHGTFISRDPTRAADYISSSASAYTDLMFGLLDLKLSRITTPTFLPSRCFFLRYSSYIAQDTILLPHE